LGQFQCKTHTNCFFAPLRGLGLNFWKKYLGRIKQ
jgi:hypothetical protein